MNCIKKIAYVFVLLLMTTGTAWGMNIFRAAATGNIGRIEELLDAEPTVAARRALVNHLGYFDHETALHLAARHGHEAVAIRLIAAGADVNLQDRIGSTALHGATGYGQGAIVSILLEAGADVNQQDPCGWTALHFAASKDNEAVAIRLIAAGADVNLQDRMGYTALHRAAMNGHEAVVLRLIKAGADIDTQDCDEGMAALHWAAMNGHDAVVCRLIEADAFIEQPDHKHWMPWHWAISFGHKTIASRFEEAIASRLIETNRRSDSAYYGKVAPYINDYIQRIDQARQRAPVIAHTLALATHSAASPLALLPQELIRHIARLVVQAEEMDARRPRQANGGAL